MTMPVPSCTKRRLEQLFRVAKTLVPLIRLKTILVMLKRSLNLEKKVIDFLCIQVYPQALSSRSASIFSICGFQPLNLSSHAPFLSFIGGEKEETKIIS